MALRGDAARFASVAVTGAGVALDLGGSPSQMVRSAVASAWLRRGDAEEKVPEWLIRRLEAVVAAAAVRSALCAANAAGPGPRSMKRSRQMPSITRRAPVRRWEQAGESSLCQRVRLLVSAAAASSA